VATGDPLELARRGRPEMIAGGIFSAAVTSLQYRRRCTVPASYVTVPEKVANSLAYTAVVVLLNLIYVTACKAGLMRKLDEFPKNTKLNVLFTFGCLFLCVQIKFA
jgi:hypothetical protein